MVTAFLLLAFFLVVVGLMGFLVTVVPGFPLTVVRAIVGQVALGATFERFRAVVRSAYLVAEGTRFS